MVYRSPPSWIVPMSGDPLFPERELPRQSGGKFGKGSGFTSEQAREAAKKGTRVSKKDFQGRVAQLLEDANFGNGGKSAPETIRLLAEKAIKGSSADLRLFLQQTGQLQDARDKYDGTGPCPTCGQTPGEGLTLAGKQFDSLAAALAELEGLLSLSERTIVQEKKLDERVAA